MAELKWYASNYLDDERCGVVDGDNRIIVRLNEGKSREECEQIAAEHNRKLEGGDLQKQVGMAEARDIETLLKEFEAAVETVYTSGNSVRSIEQFNVKRAELRAAYSELEAKVEELKRENAALKASPAMKLGMAELERDERILEAMRDDEKEARHG